MFKIRYPLIYVVLGNGCNMNCNYCVKRETSQITHKINPAIYSFLHELNCGDRRTITFYGGEPTLYFNEMKCIVENLKDKFGFSTMTNGKAITTEMVNFFNEYFRSVNLSWDGEKSVLTRGYDSVATNKENLLKINNLWLTGVITKYNYPLDMLNSYREFDKEYYKIHNQHVCVYLNVPIKSFESDIFDIDYDRVHKEIEYIMNYEGKDDLTLFVKEQSLNSWGSKYYAETESFLCKCGCALALGIDGTIYACQNNNIPIGNINCHYPRMLERLHSFNRMDKEECESCKIFKLCSGGCYFPGDMEHFCKAQHSILEPIVDYLERGKNG